MPSGNYFIKPQAKTPLEGISEVLTYTKRSSLWRDTMKRFWANKLAAAGVVVILVLILVALLTPLLVPYENAIGFYPQQVLQPPSFTHIMGTDVLGRDVFARVLYGAQISIAVGLGAEGIGVILGLLLGILASYYSRILDSVIMRAADVFFAFPYVLGALAIMTVLGRGFINIIIAIGVLEWAYVARLFRSSVLSVKESDYVEAAKALGAGNRRIISRHILPNAVAPVAVYAAMSVGGAILTEAALSFLGLGVKLPQPSWGAMLSESMAYMETAPWLMVFPGLFLLITVLSCVLVADGLRDALDPRLK